jgi:ADP-L-glycero-D-manno-heptose 6-epimerase
MIIVTGGAGFIGSRIIKELNNRGENDIILVDDLSDASKINNIRDLDIKDYIDKDDFIELLGLLADTKTVRGIYHMGAESATTCTDGKYLMKNNYQYTCNIMSICASSGIPLVYASSASVYGNAEHFDDTHDDYMPNNMYGFSKLLADKFSRQYSASSKIIGCRYFNVYSDGEFEKHKEGMKSPTAWMRDQLEDKGYVELFEDSAEFRRDFLHVDDVVEMTIALMHKGKNGTYNIGSGYATSFEEMAITIDEDIEIKYIEMPKELSKHYQKYTLADMTSFLEINRTNVLIPPS